MKRENRLSVKSIGCTFIFITLVSLISVHLNSELISLSERSSSNSPWKTRVHSMGELKNLYNYIFIDGNDQFRQIASERNWAGEGTEEQPFKIKDLTLQGTNEQTLIEIRDTSVYFTITNCLITGGEIGINLASITNGRIENNTIRFSTNVGLRLGDVGDSQIIENNFSNCSTGIEVDQSSNIEVETNRLSNNSYYGVRLWDSSNNSFRENYILNNNGDALQLFYSSNNHLIQNFISGNAWDGLSLRRSETNTIRDNQIENNSRGILLDRSPDNSIVNNTLVNNGLVLSGREIDSYEQAEVLNNTVNQKPLIWWQDVSEKTVPEAGEIILLNCSDLVIIGQNMTSASMGIFTYFCSNISIYNNSISNNTDSGISLFNVENCTISSNNITNNGRGIYAEHFSGVKIANNLIKNTLGRGIEVIHNDLEIFEFNGHEYALIDAWLPWKDARVYCENLGGHLVTIGSASENDFVENLADPIDDDVWIGLNDEATEGYWEWVTGEPLTYTNWADNEPNGGGGENYVEMHRDGTWNDLPVTSSMYFVCEWENIQTAKTHSSISRNAIINNSNGIRLENIQNIQVNDNDIINNSFSGLEVEDSNACNITNNNLSNNGGGIKLTRSSSNRITNNTLVGNGLIIEGWDSAHFIQGEIVNNSVNRKPLIYWVNISDKTIIEAGQIFLINCYNITILNQNLSYASRGIVGFNCTKIVLTNSTVNYNSEFGVMFRRSTDCAIINNTISFNHQAIQIEDHDKFTITNNTISMNQAGGIIIRWRALSPSVISTIKDNRVINSSRGIDLRDVLDVLVINNTIINNSECGIRIQDGYDINVTGNLVDQNGGGIELRYAEGCILTNNTIIGHGFDIEGMEAHQFDQWIVQNNTVNGKPIVFWRDITDRVVPEHAGQVFLIRAQRINVTNLIFDSVANSIYTIDSDAVTIRDCQFSNNSRVALRIHSTRSCDISGNSLTHNNQGIELWDSSDTQILENIIHNNTGAGVSVWDSPFTVIHNNSIMNHHSEGLRVGSSNFCDLLSNIIANNNGQGIDLWDSWSTQILGNIIHNNSWHGISAHGSSNVISNNEVVNNDGSGIRVHDSSNYVISDNKVANSNGPGIELRWGTEECTIEHNLIHNNSNGISLRDSSAHDITNNTISENYDMGIWAEDVSNTRIINNTVSSNCISDPLLAGIHLGWSSHNTIERNELSTNGIAFNFEGATDNEIIHNLVENNSYGFYLNQDCTDNTIRYNDFISNFHLIQKQIFTGSQVFDDGSDNIFIFNHYNDWVSPDDDLDGYVDSPYLISGSTQNSDPCPLTQPYPPLTRRFFGNQVIYPNGGETVYGTILIEWTKAWDSHDNLITYSVYFSEDNGENWTVITRTFIRFRTSIIWDTSECYDGSLYLIKVVAHASDGFAREDISDGTFTVRNGIQRAPSPPSPTSPPPLAVRILLFVFLCLFLIVVSKRGRTQAS